MTRRWIVEAGADAVLEVVDAPGPLVSTAPRTGPPPPHPFLSATALDAAHEHRLRELLLAASDVDGFLAALEAAGYRVRAAG